MIEAHLSRRYEIAFEAARKHRGEAMSKLVRRIFYREASDE